jgi:uncharacterized membrane protein YcaP (DUF421 family)
MEVILRAAVAFLFLWGVFRAVGRRELAQLSAFEIVLLIVIGDLVQQGITGEDHSLVSGLAAAATVALLSLLISTVALRSAKARRLLEGDPVMVVDDGEVDQKVLWLHRFSLDDLKAEARRHGIEDLATIKAGVLEPDGRVSFIQDSSSSDGDDEPRLP